MKKKKDGAAATPSLKDCANCGAREGTVPGSPTHSSCARCGLAWYCARACQAEHWKHGHKQQCVKKEDRRVVRSEDDDDRGAERATQPECAICLEPLTVASQSQKLPCKHTYHTDCVNQLRKFGIKQVCPLCRADLPPGPEQLFEEGIRRWVILERRYTGSLESPYQAHSKPWSAAPGKDQRELEKCAGLLRAAAEQNEARSQCCLAQIYHYGKGLPQDIAVAMKWYEMAAASGLPLAQGVLGIIYDTGQSGPRDEVLAAQWYRKAAEQVSH